MIQRLQFLITSLVEQWSLLNRPLFLKKDYRSFFKNSITMKPFILTLLCLNFLMITTPVYATAPSITSNNSFSITENITTISTLSADTSVTWSINGGADQAEFIIDSSTGELIFAEAPNYESVDDSNSDNIYEVEIKAAEAGNSESFSTENITITILDDTTDGHLVTDGNGVTIKLVNGSSTDVGKVYMLDGNMSGHYYIIADNAVLYTIVDQHGINDAWEYINTHS